MVGGGAALTTLTGTMVGGAGGPVTLLALMLASTLASLIAALAVRRLEAGEGAEETT